MHELTEIVILLAVAVFGAALARKIGVLSPIVLMIIGLGLSFLPGFPEFHLEPELVLIGILPPLLYIAALQTSVPAFRFNLRPILLLGIGLVVFTALGVGWVVHLIIPEAPFAVCVALGAVVAPPDAVSATAIARRIGLPRRVVTILEGESLINDASALVLLRVATAAAVGGAVGFGEVAEQVVVSAGGGIAIGIAGALIFGYLHKKIKDPLLDNALSLLIPFAVVIASEAIHASGVVAVVVTGLALGHRMPTLMAAGSRLQMDAFWRLIRFLLEGLVFLLVGLQLRTVINEITTPWGTVFAATGAVIATLIVTRYVWVVPGAFLPRLSARIRSRETTFTWRHPVIIGWAGMRGVVTLAAALALPSVGTGENEALYPRDVFIFIAFAVIVFTLLVFGLTLPMFARMVGLPPDDPTKDFLAEAAVQQAATRAAKARLEENLEGAPESVVQRLRQQVIDRTNTAWERLGGDGRETPSAAYGRLRQEMIDAEREVFRTARDEGRIPEEVLTRAYRDLDLEESLLQRREDD
ncbi:Na+/H+ antiporter [Asanoa iriomotensis]|uniref:Na+/H+ antiporter n=1 Tax=Asanoa iriomotensis TaxID=234613 RepID=A0ABQ4C8N1_9ACTN|nr:Na+/H+ antiporter [Asanoa iriomotensis]GIF59138.1 Na+/H+ antiporter [Asanoa iriomotensis]